MGTNIKNLNRRKIDEIAQVHPMCYAYLLYNQYQNIVYEHLINGIGKIDFVATNNDNELEIFECKNNLYNPMALNKAAAQCYTYVKATKARRGILVAPIDTVYPDAYIDIKNIFKDCDIEIMEVPILEKASNQNMKKTAENIKKLSKETLVVDKSEE